MIDVKNFTVADLPANRKVEPPPNIKHTRYVGTKMVKLNSIEGLKKDDIAQNSARSKGKLQEHLDNLITSFGAGVRTDLPIPSVYLLKNPFLNDEDNWIEYRHADGFHRLNALKEMGITEYPCDIWEQCNDLNNQTVDDLWYKYGANNHPPGVRPSNNDTIGVFGKLINLRAPQICNSNGELDEELLKKELARYSVKVTAKLIYQIKQKAGLPITYKQWTGDEAAEWCQKHMTNYTLEEDLHILNEGNGTWERTLLRVLVKAYETGSPQTCILNTVKGKPNPIKDRKAFKKKILEKVTVLQKLFKGTKNADDIIKIDYALPQTREGDDREDFDYPINLNTSPYI